MIRQADMRDVDTLTDLTLELWPDHSRQEMKTELQRQLSAERAVYFLAVEEENMAGFAQCQLRHDYVEGTESSPVGYLEGIYVRNELRGRGGAGFPTGLKWKFADRWQLQAAWQHNVYVYNGDGLEGLPEYNNTHDLNGSNIMNNDVTSTITLGIVFEFGKGAKICSFCRND